jgi:hypothetical protein
MTSTEPKSWLVTGAVLLQPESTTFGELSIADYAERIAETIPAVDAHRELSTNLAHDDARVAT